MNNYPCANVLLINARKIYGHVELHTSSAKALALGHSFPRQPNMPGAGTEPAVNSPVRSFMTSFRSWWNPKSGSKKTLSLSELFWQWMILDNFRGRWKKQTIFQWFQHVPTIFDGKIHGIQIFDHGDSNHLGIPSIPPPASQHSPQHCAGSIPMWPSLCTTISSRRIDVDPTAIIFGMNPQKIGVLPPTKNRIPHMYGAYFPKFQWVKILSVDHGNIWKSTTMLLKFPCVSSCFMVEMVEIPHLSAKLPSVSTPSPAASRSAVRPANTAPQRSSVADVWGHKISNIGSTIPNVYYKWDNPWYTINPCGSMWVVYIVALLRLCQIWIATFLGKYPQYILIMSPLLLVINSNISG